jgi:hypothetical protein
MTKLTQKSFQNKHNKTSKSMGGAKLPTTLHGAINRAKLDIRKHKLEVEKDGKLVAKLKAAAEASIKNADEVAAGTNRVNWRRELLFISRSDIFGNGTVYGWYGNDNKEHWNIDKVPFWALHEEIDIKEPEIDEPIFVRGKEFKYKAIPAAAREPR